MQMSMEVDRWGGNTSDPKEMSRGQPICPELYSPPPSPSGLLSSPQNS